jgi:predicted acetyltransferase
VGAVCCVAEGGAAEQEADEEREERARAKAWVRQAKMRRVLAELEDREATRDASASGAAKLTKLVDDHDQDSQHIMGLLQVRLGRNSRVWARSGGSVCGVLAG